MASAQLGWCTEGTAPPQLCTVVVTCGIILHLLLMQPATCWAPVVALPALRGPQQSPTSRSARLRRQRSGTRTSRIRQLRTSHRAATCGRTLARSTSTTRPARAAPHRSRSAPPPHVRRRPAPPHVYKEMCEETAHGSTRAAAAPGSSSLRLADPSTPLLPRHSSPSVSVCVRCSAFAWVLVVRFP
jgi:hypothetical protein